jgi:sulfite oxidase
VAKKSISRRMFLISGTAALCHTTFLCGSQNSSGAQSSSTRPDGERMIVHSEEYITREMPVSLLNTWISPVEYFFVRNNLLMPSKFTLDNWRLRITGEVAKPLELRFADIARLDPHEVTNTLECAGNGRAFFQPRIGGVRWERGAVGNAQFSGPALGNILRMASLKPTARHVAFRGLDVAPHGAEPFIRSIPLEKALDPDTLLAFRMNGAPLTPEHGYPARVLVPGWTGSASIKWVTEMEVLPTEYRGYYMSSAYRLPKDGANRVVGTTSEWSAITSLPVKSVIAHPAAGAVFSLRTSEPVRISGAAWAGDVSIARVDVSIDGGRLWQPASLSPEGARYAWRLWNFDWKPQTAGKYLVMSRATDTAGRSQPLETTWNPQGYLWNGVDRIAVTVTGSEGASRN